MEEFRKVDNLELLTALKMLEKEKGISKDYMIEAIETALSIAYKKSMEEIRGAEVVVKMNPENQDKESKKLSYDELENAAQNLSAQYQNLVNKYKELYAENQELKQNNYFVRLEWLFRVINSDKFNPDFRNKCEEEFVNMMIPETTEENKE